MARLRKADCSAPGIRRRKRGRGFEYLGADGNRITEPSVLERIRELAIPPAWEDVWICPWPFGHIQATGVDAAGRKQYRYHDLWREHRDREKFEQMEDFAKALPRLRRRVAKDLKQPGMPRQRALALAARLLDRGFFRIGSEDYAEENDTYGLATMQKRHVTIDREMICFDYEAKGGKGRKQAITDREAAALVEQLKRRRGGMKELLAYKEGQRWVDVKSDDINEYVKEVSKGDFTSKDFRTWSATVIAAIALAFAAEQGLDSKTARKRAKTGAIKTTAEFLGNTPAVCRASYIDPRVFDRFDGGLTIGGVLPHLEDADTWPEIQRTVEEAVLDLIAGEQGSPALEKVA
jgi:DNA topoisomerase IB